MNKKVNCIMLVDDNKDDNFFHERVIKKNNDNLKQDRHLTVHKKFISEFYFNEPRLVIRPNTENMKLR